MSQCTGWEPILPGSTVGILGSGQLGRMLAIEARRMGYRVEVFSPDAGTPTGQIADRKHCASYDDRAAIRQFAENADVVTYEFENVPAETIELMEGLAPVRPQGIALHVAQHRLREKEFMVNNGIPVTDFKAIRDEGDIASLVESDCPAILKTASSGYDGKGQIRVDTLGKVEEAWNRLERQEAILERLVPFEEELSVVGVRGSNGVFAQYGPILNRHANHILDLSILGADLPRKACEEATEITRAVLSRLDVAGVICIEFFMRPDGSLLVNEIAPRPHNSGHLTIDACVTCQFEQQLRTICGLPIGSTQNRQPAAMANLLGDVWANGEPRWKNALSNSNVKLHLYGKQEPRPGRKMGHLTVTAETAESAAQQAVQARLALMGK